MEGAEMEGMDETEAVPVKSRGAGLRPPAPSSVDPKGIPSRPTAAAFVMPVGEDAEAVGRAKAVLPPGVHVPDVVPVLPPSNMADPVREELLEPILVAVPVAGPPNDACGIELPKPEQTAVPLIARPVGVVPGDMPAETISVAPRGIPAGATGTVAPIPSGEVMLSGEGLGAPPTGPTWDIAKPGQSAIASITATMKRVISMLLDLPRRD
jgi:hypothetical protein